MNVMQFTISAKNCASSRERTDARLESFHLGWRPAAADSPADGASSDGYLTASPGPLSSGGCGWASPVVPGGRSLLVSLVSTRWMVVANAAMMVTATTAAKIAKVIWVRR